MAATLLSLAWSGLVIGSPGGSGPPPVMGAASGTLAGAEDQGWGPAEIQASWRRHPGPEDSTQPPRPLAQPLLVLSRDGRVATLLDAEALRVVHRFEGLFNPVLGPGPHPDPRPIHAPDGRHVYVAWRDGWVSKLDVQRLTSEAEIRCGVETQGLALSHDARALIVANQAPHTLVVLNAETLAPLKVIEARDARGRSSPVTAVRTIAARGSFVAAFEDLPEVWEISYRFPPPLGFGHWTHDHRKEGGDATAPPPFPIRRLRTDGPLDDLHVTLDGVQMIGTSPQGPAEIVDLDLGRTHGRLDLPGWPRLGAAASWRRGGIQVIAAPNRRGGGLTVLDTGRWTVLAEIPRPGRDGFVAAHDRSPYLWVGGAEGLDRDALTLINKQTLNLTQVLRPVAGQAIDGVYLTQDGRRALVMVPDLAEGLILVYDAWTLEELAQLRIPFEP